MSDVAATTCRANATWGDAAEAVTVPALPRVIRRPPLPVLDVTATEVLAVVPRRDVGVSRRSRGAEAAVAVVLLVVGVPAAAVGGVALLVLVALLIVGVRP